MKKLKFTKGPGKSLPYWTASSSQNRYIIEKRPDGFHFWVDNEELSLVTNSFINAKGLMNNHLANQNLD